MDNADTVLELSDEPVRDQVRWPNADVTKMEAACGGTILLSLSLSEPKQNWLKDSLNYPWAVCLGIILTLRLLSSRALSFRMIIYKLMKDRLEIKAEV